jgi:hypothetical protein
MAQQSRAATIKAADLDAQITVAEAALDTVDKKEALKEADPQSASMANAIGADRNVIAALSQAFFAIAIEFGSGVGFWLVFGHTGPGRRDRRVEVIRLRNRLSSFRLTRPGRSSPLTRSPPTSSSASSSKSCARRSTAASAHS